MGDKSTIEWTDATWNPVTGCDRVSPGCAHCYALELAPRLRAMGVQRYVTARDGGKSSGPAFGVTLHPDVLGQPLRWRRPRRIFVNSMSDLFHDEIPLEYIGRVFNVMGRARQHTFQVLTKRPERMQPIVEAYYDTLGIEPYPNVWLGVSIENRRFLGRADELRETPAAVRFISAEPLLGPLVEWMFCSTCSMEGPDPSCDECEGVESWPLQGSTVDLTDIDWLIVGGESGPRLARGQPRLGAQPVRPRAAPRHRVLLQAVGRPHPKGRRPRARRPHLGPDARAGAGVRRSRKDIALGRHLTIGQTWRDRETGRCWRVDQVHRGDCHVGLRDVAGVRRTIRFEQLRDGWDQVVPADQVVAA